MSNPSQMNAATLEKELLWLSEITTTRGKITFEQSLPEDALSNVKPPDISGDESHYAAFIREHEMSFEERLVLVLSLVPHTRPELLDILFTKNPSTDQPFTELGGQKGIAYRGFLPTGETAVFLLAGNSLEKRFTLLCLFEESHFFHRLNILRLGQVPANEPAVSGVLTISDEYLHRLTTGNSFKPDFNSAFPAKRIYTSLDWSDLVVPEETLEELSEIRTWLVHGHTLLNEMGFGRKIKAGYRVLFSGPPGTGKTLTASLLGKTTGMDVYRVDLSMVVSKYIGETEKNLSLVFDLAENKNWILFFDEADALFGKRTNTNDAHDRHANQEVSYLLQRIEDFPGLVILATNFRKNIDEAFSRRFQLLVNFPVPDYEQRLRLWKHAFGAPFTLADDINLEKLAFEHEITGAAIMNILRYCCLRSLERADNVIVLTDIQSAIKKELVKEGKTVF